MPRGLGSTVHPREPTRFGAVHSITGMRHSDDCGKRAINSQGPARETQKDKKIGMQDEINPVVVDPVRRATSALPLTQRRLVVEMYNKRGAQCASRLPWPRQHRLTCRSLSGKEKAKSGSCIRRFREVCGGRVCGLPPGWHWWHGCVVLLVVDRRPGLLV